MGQHTSIEWTDHTFNPWWGCTKVSAGCKNCYAEVWANRYGHDLWGGNKQRRFFGESHWNEPIKWNKSATASGRRTRVFCASMADVFEDNPIVDIERSKLWKLIERTPMLDWLLLTKRPENMPLLSPWKTQWPDNVWAMTSVEDQEQAAIRIPHLTQIPAVVKGLSVEPLLAPIDLSPWIADIDWVIVGGESGRHARPMEPAWVRQIRDVCTAAMVPFFFKQWGEWSPQVGGSVAETGNTDTMYRAGKRNAGRLLDQATWNEVPQYRPAPTP